MTQLSIPSVLRTIIDRYGESLAKEEGLDTAALEAAVHQGSMVILANPSHPNVSPVVIGQPARIKVNANLGTSPLIDDADQELIKIKAAMEAGAHAVMDLSTSGDLDAVRTKILAACPLPLGTVPIYSLAKQCIDSGRDPSEFEPEELIAEIEKQAKQGVDFMTLHMGVTRRAAELVENTHGTGRLLGIVSRGGSILARWMRRRGEENPLLTHLEPIFKICRDHNVTISLGDGLRPGAGADAGDAAQWEEVVVLSDVTHKARQAGVQVMIEGPGHVPLNLVQSQIQGIKALTHGAPLYVLGPLTTDSAPGYDHIGAAIGGAMAGYFGADFLCYVTPAEHLTLPCADDVRQGVMASRIAAHSAEVALGRPWAVQRDRDISIARKELDWDRITELAMDPVLVKHRRKDHSHEKECAMCGKFCAIKMVDDTL